MYIYIMFSGRGLEIGWFLRPKDGATVKYVHSICVSLQSHASVGLFLGSGIQAKPHTHTHTHNIFLIPESY